MLLDRSWSATCTILLQIFPIGSFSESLLLARDVYFPDLSRFPGVTAKTEFNGSMKRSCTSSTASFMHRYLSFFTSLWDGYENLSIFMKNLAKYYGNLRDEILKSNPSR